MGSKVYIVAGEVSGDNHGSGLMTEMGALDSEIQFYGMGGPDMANHSQSVKNWISDSAVVGFWEVIKKYRFFKEVFDRVVQEIEDVDPDMVILVAKP